MSKVFSFLNEPFPQTDEDKIILRIAVIFGAVIFFILAVFQPFDFSNAQGSEVFYYAFIFSLITISVILSYEFFLKYILGVRRDHPGWTLGKWFLSNILLACCIATANYFYATFEYELPHSLPRYLSSIKSTVAIGILPILGFGAIVQAGYARRNEKLASKINFQPGHPTEEESPKLVRLPILQSDKYLELDIRQIICAEAMQNYVQIYSWDGTKVEKEMIRNTISNIEAVLENTAVKRSHRSYLVHKDKINHISGNAQGLRLDLDPTPGFWVQVSRKYLSEFKNQA